MDLFVHSKRGEYSYVLFVFSLLEFSLFHKIDA